MSDSIQNKPETKSISPEQLAFLEKAWDWQWALRLICLVLFADLVLLWSGQAGLLGLSLGINQALQNLGPLLVALTAFAFANSILIPGLASAITLLIIAIPWPRWLKSDPDSRREYGRVQPRALLDLALAEKSDFLLALYKQHQRQQDENRKLRNQVGSLIFCALVLATINGTATYWAGANTSLVETLYCYLGHGAGRAFQTVLLMVGFALKWAWFTADDSDGIYYPPLYAQLNDKTNLQ